jgi:hypothetical protein
VERFQQLGFLILALTITSCSAGKGTEPAKSRAATVAASTGTTATSPSRLCSLFTTAEIKELLGTPVGEGKVAGPLGSACQWDGNSAGDDGVYAQIQLINDTHYWEKHTGAKGYEALRGIGKEAFVASALGGWEAGTVTDRAVVFASVSGGSASRDTAVRFLRSTLERLGMK